MRTFLILSLGCLLVAGCARPPHPQKPSPYHYAHPAPTLMLGAYEKEPI